MDDLEKLALAGLVHDLPALMPGAGITPPAGAQRLLALAQPGSPALETILHRAEQFAGAGNENRPLALDKALISIFSRVQLWQSAEPDLKYYRLAPLPRAEAPQELLFPGNEPEMTGLPGHVRELARELDWLATHVDLEDFERVYAHLLALLQRYTWCLPAHAQDVSFFDHARLASASAVCLFRWQEEGRTTELPIL